MNTYYNKNVTKLQGWRVWKRVEGAGNTLPHSNTATDGASRVTGRGMRASIPVTITRREGLQCKF